MSELEESYRLIADLWCAQDWEAWQRTVALAYTFEPGVGEPLDRDGTLAWSRAIFAAFPDYRQELEYVITQERTVVGVAIARGTFSGRLQVGEATLDGSGRTFELPYVKVLEFDREGLVVHDRQYMDHQALLAAVVRS